VTTPRAPPCSSPGWASFTSAQRASFGPALTALLTALGRPEPRYSRLAAAWSRCSG
jgi:hypothetical protein